MSSQVKHIRAVVFDCDGVLMNSVSEKISAFREWVRTFYPRHEEEFIRYHLASYGNSRTVQIKHFYHEILRVPIDEGSFEKMLGHLGHLIEKRMKDVRLNEGASETISRLAEKGVKIFVVSGAPQEQLEFHMHRLEIALKTDGIFGAPTSKESGLRLIMESYGFTPDDMIFVGDATADALASSYFDIRFVYFPSVVKMESEKIWRKIKKLKDLELYV